MSIGGKDNKQPAWLLIAVALIGVVGASMVCCVPIVVCLVDIYLPVPTKESDNKLPTTQPDNQYPQDTSSPEMYNSQPKNATEPQDEIQPTSTSLLKENVNQYDGWIICWHGRDGYEYLIAYPKNQVQAGLRLKFNLKNAQGHDLELANDLLKMCYVDGEWYGYPDPSPWFPNISYIKLQDKQLLACSDSPGCKGDEWTLLPEKYFPSNAPELQPLTEANIHVITYTAP